MKRKSKKQAALKQPMDLRSFIGGCFVAVVVLGAVIDRIWKLIPPQAKEQHAQLVEIPEITEEIDQPQEEVPTAANPTPNSEPEPLPQPDQDILREVEIEGPVDAIVGDAVHLRVRSQGGTPINYAWNIAPEVDGLFVLDDGSSAIFTNRSEQTYTVFVSAVDMFGNLEQDTFTFNLVRQKDSMTLQNLAEANPDPTIPELLDYYVTLVNSPNKEREVLMVAQSFRQTANLLRTGAIQSNQDVLAKMMKGLEISMTPQVLQNWNPFFRETRALLNKYKEQGHLETRDAYINTFDNLAAVLESRRERKNPTLQ